MSNHSLAYFLQGRFYCLLLLHLGENIAYDRGSIELFFFFKFWFFFFEHLFPYWLVDLSIKYTSSFSVQTVHIIRFTLSSWNPFAWFLNHLRKKFYNSVLNWANRIRFVFCLMSLITLFICFLHPNFKKKWLIWTSGSQTTAYWNPLENMPTPEFLIQQVWWGAWKFAFLKTIVQIGALWQPRGVGWGWMGWELVPVAIQQKRTEHCKAIILQLKINFKSNEMNK